MTTLQRIAEQAAAPSPEQLRQALLDLAQQLPEGEADRARALAKRIPTAGWYRWEQLQQSEEIRAIDMQEAAGKISESKAMQLRIAVAMRG